MPVVQYMNKIRYMVVPMEYKKTPTSVQSMPEEPFCNMY